MDAVATEDITDAVALEDDAVALEDIADVAFLDGAGGKINVAFFTIYKKNRMEKFYHELIPLFFIVIPKSYNMLSIQVL